MQEIICLQETQKCVQVCSLSSAKHFVAPYKRKSQLTLTLLPDPEL